MRRYRSRGPRPFLLALAVVALASEFYALEVQHRRELARVDATMIASAATQAQELARQLVAAAATPAPAVQTPRDALTRALNAMVDVLRDPEDGRLGALQGVAEAEFVLAFQRELDHLKRNRLRLSERSGYRVLAVESIASEADQADLLTEEQWLYEEQGASGEIVRCLLETSRQRYLLERRGDRWVVATLTLANNPHREPCPER